MKQAEIIPDSERSVEERNDLIMANTRKDNKGRSLHTGEQQRKDGMYLYRYVDITGKRQTIYAKNLQELRLKEKQLKKDIDDSILTDLAIKKMTLNELFTRYMNTKSLSDSTRSNYNKMWNNRVKDELGNCKVVQLRSSNIKAFYMRLSNAGYSHSTIKLIHTMIFPALEMAVEDDIIRKNPAKNALLSSYGAEAKEKEILTLEQQQRLFEFLENSKIYNMYIPMLTILIETGLRCGEMIGLTWNDVSLSENWLSVNHQLVYKNFGDGCKFHATTPKTDAGMRTIPLTKNVIKAFSEQKKINFLLGRHCIDEIDGYSDFIFVAKTNRPYMPAGVNNVLYNIVDAYNKNELKKAKAEHRKAELLPKFSVHTLRHTSCTNRARQGMNIKVLQYLMGHSDSSVTLDVYNHLDNEADVRKEVLKYENQKAI